MNSGAPPAVTGVGLVGKAPARADFLRLEGDEVATQGLLGWLAEADEACRRTAAVPPQTPVRFLLLPPPARVALIGTLVSSVDQVGRSFPLAAFAALPAPALASRLSLLPGAFAGFFDAAEALLFASASATVAALTEAVRALPRPGAVSWQAAEAERRDRLARSSAPWLAALSNDLPSGAHFAFQTFLSAVLPELAAAEAKAPVILDCPVGADPDGPWPWLDLAARALRWSSRPPTFLWTRTTPARLLLCLGAATPATLSVALRPQSNAPTLWPLRTSQAKAAEAARQALALDQRAALEGPALSFDALLARLAP